MRCGFWQYSSLVALSVLFCSCVIASESAAVEASSGEWVPVNDARHFVFVPPSPVETFTPDMTIEENSVVFLPKQTELVVIEPRVYGTPNLSQEVTKHYTWDFIVYLAWLVAFGGVLVAK